MRHVCLYEQEVQETLILCIGLGVGCAALFGTLRFVRGWSLKPLIIGSLIPCILCSCYMVWGDPRLKPILGLAWDCGAVTTGKSNFPEPMCAQDPGGLTLVCLVFVHHD
jgi:hypothetical protein